MTGILSLRLNGIGPCPEAVEWARSLGDNVTKEQIWTACERSDWLIWWLDAVDGWDDRMRRLFVCRHAERRLIAQRAAGRAVDPRSIDAVTTAYRFAIGLANRDDLDAARDAAWNAANAAWDSAARSAWGAWGAADFADFADWGAARAAWGAARANSGYAAWDATDDAWDSADSTRAAWEELRAQCNWIRAHVRCPGLA